MVDDPPGPDLPSHHDPAADDAWSRRDFVRSAAAAVGSAAFGGCTVAVAPTVNPPRGRPTLMPERRPLKLGLVGCGTRGTSAVVQALTADPRTTLWAVGDLFRDRLETCLRTVASSLGANAGRRMNVPDVRQFLGWDAYKNVIDAEIDVVLCTSCPVFYSVHVPAAIAAGKHVFVEQPIAVDAPGVRTMLTASRDADRRGLRVHVGLGWRHHDGMRAFYDQVNAGKLGDVITAQSNYLAGAMPRLARRPEWTDMEFQLRNWWHFTWLSGDHIVEQAVHNADRLSWAMNDRLPKRVTCIGGRAARSGAEQGNAYDNFSATYEFDGGKRGFLSSRQIDDCPNENSDYVFGSEGMATCTIANKTYIIDSYAGRPLWMYTGIDPRNMYQTEQNDLFGAIRNGYALNMLDRGAHTTLMAIMARMSAYTGQTVTWQLALDSKEKLTPESYTFGPLSVPTIAIPGVTRFE